MRIFLLLLILILPMTVSARTCSKCQGSGKMKVFHGMATYGVRKEKKKCPVCRELIPVGITHYDTCDRCNGTGQVSSSIDRRREERSARLEDQANEGLSYLSPAELSQFNAYKELLKGHNERVDCHACQASGKCPQCRGTGSGFNGYCYICSGTGRCIGCQGRGIARWEQVDPTEEEQQEIESRMASLVINAMNRHNGNNSFSLFDDEDVDQEKSEETSWNEEETIDAKVVDNKKSHKRIIKTKKIVKMKKTANSKLEKSDNMIVSWIEKYYHIAKEKVSDICTDISQSYFFNKIKRFVSWYSSLGYLYAVGLFLGFIYLFVFIAEFLGYLIDKCNEFLIKMRDGLEEWIDDNSDWLEEKAKIIYEIKKNIK